MVNITLKHDLSLLNSASNPLWGFIIEVSTATNHLFFPGIILSLFIILTWLFINRTQDIGKSFASSLFICSVLTLIIYYAGKTAGINVISDIFMLGILVLTSMTIAGLYFSRSKI